jgi:dTDP-4-dehydrorhamnose 3,5-epimerase
VKFTPLSIPGAWLIEPVKHQDERGVFRRHFCAVEFAEHRLETAVVQGNVSENFHKGTLRGFHFQLPPHEEAKTLSCLSGAVHDIVVDLRPASPTYLKWEGVDLDAENRRALHVPAGCAHAFLTLRDNTLVHYYVSSAYAPTAERGVRFDDPLFGFRWPAAVLTLSDRDRAFPDFDPAAPVIAR